MFCFLDGGYFCKIKLGMCNMDMNGFVYVYKILFMKVVNSCFQLVGFSVLIMILDFIMKICIGICFNCLGFIGQVIVLKGIYVVWFYYLCF